MSKRRKVNMDLCETLLVQLLLQTNPCSLYDANSLMLGLTVTEERDNLKERCEILAKQLEKAQRPTTFQDRVNSVSERTGV